MKVKGTMAQTYNAGELDELTDRVVQLKERYEQGKMTFASHLLDDFTASLSAIRLRPDGRVDPATVDGRIRAATLAVKAIGMRNEIKNAIGIGYARSLF